MIRISFPLLRFFLDTFPPEEQRWLLRQRLEILQKYRIGVENQVTPLWENEVPAIHAVNVKRMIDLVSAEILGTNRLLENCSQKQR